MLENHAKLDAKGKLKWVGDKPFSSLKTKKIKVMYGWIAINN
jgi:hypothetical protein